MSWLRQRLTDPTPRQVQVGLMISCTVALLAFAFSIYSLKTSVDGAADRAGSRAARESLCAMWDFQRVRPGDPPPTTLRGQDLARRAQLEYERLGCR